jgi:hypothetical protein
LRGFLRLNMSFRRSRKFGENAVGRATIVHCLDRAAVPRITTPFMLPSPQRTSSASATSVITWLNPIPHMIAVYASAPPLPVGPATLATGRLATPYPGGTSTRWTAPASPGAPVANRTPSYAAVFAGWVHHDRRQTRAWLYRPMPARRPS